MRKDCRARRASALGGAVIVVLLSITLLALAACSSEQESSPGEPAVEQEAPAATEGAGESGSDDAAPADERDALIDAKCTRCHSRTRIDNASKTAEEWTVTVERMIRNGADLTESEKADIIDYLSTR